MASWWRTNVIEKVHGFRIPLPRAGQNLMTCVYILGPVVAGYYIMEYTNKIQQQNLPELENAYKSQVGQIHAKYQKEQLQTMLNTHKPSDTAE